MAILAVAADQMAHAYFPHSDLGFGQYEGRGLPLVMRFVVVLVASVAIGAVLGRVLPALLVGHRRVGGPVHGSRLGFAALGAIHRADDGRVRSVRRATDNTEVRYRTPDGRLIDAQAGEEMIGAAYEAESGVERARPVHAAPGGRSTASPANRYPEVVVRESAALGAGDIGHRSPCSLRRGAPSARMMATFLRLTWRLQRWEIAVLVGGSLLFAGITALAAWQTSVTSADLQACYSTTSGGSPSSACQTLIERGNLLTTLDPILEGATTVLPFIVGILLGAPLVAREIEKRTSSIAWSLSLSRTRWLALRAAPILIAVGVALLLVGQASEALITATPDGSSDSGSSPCTARWSRRVVSQSSASACWSASSWAGCCPRSW